MSFIIEDGLVQINESSERRITNFHLEHGFAILTAFRGEHELYNELASRLKSLGYRYIRVIGQYIKSRIPNSPVVRRAKSRSGGVTVLSFLVPMYDKKEHKVIADFITFRHHMCVLGKEFDQDTIFVSPPPSVGSPSFVVTNRRVPQPIRPTDCTFSKFTLAAVAKDYSTMIAPSIDKVRSLTQDGASGFQFESAWLTEPAHTINGVRYIDFRNELAPFGSYLYSNSTLHDVVTLEQQVKRLADREHFKQCERQRRLERLARNELTEL